MHVILSYSSNKLTSCVKSKIAFYSKFLAQAYLVVNRLGQGFFIPVNHIFACSTHNTIHFYGLNFI